MNTEQQIEWGIKLQALEHQITLLKNEASRQEVSWLTSGLAGLEGYAWGLRDAVSRAVTPTELNP